MLLLSKVGVVQRSQKTVSQLLKQLSWKIAGRMLVPDLYKMWQTMQTRKLVRSLQHTKRGREYCTPNTTVTCKVTISGVMSVWFLFYNKPIESLHCLCLVFVILHYRWGCCLLPSLSSPSLLFFLPLLLSLPPSSPSLPSSSLSPSLSSSSLSPSL